MTWIGLLAGLTVSVLTTLLAGVFLSESIASWLGFLAGFGTFSWISESQENPFGTDDIYRNWEWKKFIKTQERRKRQAGALRKEIKRRAEFIAEARRQEQRRRAEQAAEERRQEEKRRAEREAEAFRQEQRRKAEQQAEALHQEEKRRAEREAEAFRQEQRRKADEAKKRETRFLRILFSMLAKMAKADGQVGREDLWAAEKVFTHFEAARRRRAFCAKVFNEAKDNSRSIMWYATLFVKLDIDESTRTYVYSVLWDIACSDGFLYAEDKRILKDICVYLNLPASYFEDFYKRYEPNFTERQKRKEKSSSRSSSSSGHTNTGSSSGHTNTGSSGSYTNTGSSSGQSSSGQSSGGQHKHREYKSGTSSILDAYDILGCSPDASDEELKAAFRRAAMKNHPDMLRQQGLPESEIAAATERMAQINAAWRDIRQSRGM